MNSFEYDFQYGIDSDSKNISTYLDKAKEQQLLGDVFKEVKYYKMVSGFLINNMLRRVESRNEIGFCNALEDFCLFIDIYNDIFVNDKYLSVHPSTFETVFSDRNISLLFLLSIIDDRFDFFDNFPEGFLTNIPYALFLCSIVNDDVGCLGFLNSGYDYLKKIDSSNYHDVLIDFLNRWPKLTKSKKINATQSRDNLNEKTIYWTGDSCYLAVLFSYLFDDGLLNEPSDYFPERLVSALQSCHAYRGSLLSYSKDKSLENVSPGFVDFECFNLLNTTGNEDYDFLLYSVYAGVDQDYLNQFKFNSSDDIYSFYGSLVDSESDISGLGGKGLYFSLCVDVKDYQSCLYFLSKVFNYYHKDGDVLIVDDAIHSTDEAIDLYNIHFERMGLCVFTLNNEDDNSCFFVTQKNNVVKLNKIFGVTTNEG